MAMDLPIGVALGTVGATAAWWLESARRLEAAGYRDVWAWDHLMGKGDPAAPVLEQWTILAAAAASTRTIGLGTFITSVTFRHPALLARMASTLQAVSGGRLTLGMGIGGFAREHAAFGIPFPPPEERAARLEAAVGAIRALWTGLPVTRDDPLFPLRGAVASPAPDPVPRILIGAQSPAGVRLAARVGDGWAAEGDGFEAFLPAYLEGLEAAGRRRADVRIVVGFGGGRTGQDALVGGPWVADLAGEWARQRARGADAVVLTARTINDVDALVAATDRV